MAGYKAISIVLLIVLVALAGLSPAFADSINIVPAAACPGVSVILSAEMTPTSWFTDIHLSSDPAGLISEYDCGWNQPLVTCDFTVSESACAGPYTVTVTLDAQGTIVGTDRVQFTVGTDLCPNVPSCSTAAVGGCVQPVNTFALLSPWMAVIGLVGCIGTVVVVAKKRRS